MKVVPLALLAVTLTAATARADVALPPPPPPPPGEMVAKIVAGTALGFAVMGLGLWLARRNRQVAAA